MNGFLLFAIANLTLVLFLSPLYISVIKKVKAILQGRHGPSVVQTYRNIFKLLKKESLYSRNSSFITRVTPYVDFTGSLLLSLFVPLIFIPNNSNIFGNIILFSYILMLTKFFIALSGLDAGSTFGGMGSSREMSVSAIIEPTIIMVFAAVAFSFNSVNFFEIIKNSLLSQNHVFLWLLFIPFIIILITESSRIPVDNPETHLELTMIHEAMVLEQSGKNLALIEWSSAIKQLVLIGIIVNIFIPIGVSTTMQIMTLSIAVIMFFIKSLLFVIGIGIIESNVAKLRFFRLSNLFAMSYFLSFITILIEVLL
ncbi:MAG: NADH-quinone oxidoreductase subunit H [Methanocellales archaeon]|nr:NADH-quinone oxidoreductase subunit H [Methanocellales archaeon]MDD3420693.1 NADH-quinone oxidoreductase subunit H [Methanocellales archaeon]MDD4897865.1 NADH-quinone oxidoreductase subunit H [Methanocellales archaeon]MDD5446431.1 NADH-quinone oxidoreductase subunit H [Methanocellales archaeon]